MLSRPSVAITALAFAMLAHPPADAQAQAGQQIKVVVPFPPGGVTDSMTRIYANHFAQHGGPTFIVENRPGAGSVIGNTQVARAAPDGATLLLASPSLVITAALRAGLAYDPRTSFEPLCQLTDGPAMLAVQASSPYKTAQDLIDAARAAPGKLNFAAVGPGTLHHVVLEMFRRAAKLDVTYVPYPGGAPSVNALLGGHVAAAFANYGELTPHFAAGTLRPLATANAKRVPLLPDVPTMREVGLNFDLPSWYGFVAPAGTPRAALAATEEALKTATMKPDVRPRLEALGLFPAIQCGADFAAFMRAQYDLYSRVAKEANLKVE